MDNAVPQSIFLVVSWDSSAPHSISILQLETQKQRPPSFSPLEEAPLNQKEYVAHFNQPEWTMMDWMFCSSTSNEDLYILPDWIPRKDEPDVPLNGCVFDFRTKTCRPMPSSGKGIRIEHVVTLGDCIYGIACPDGCYCIDLPFMRYDPARGFWQHLKPFPGDVNHNLSSSAYSIVATAVWNDTILFNMSGVKIWAYDVKRDEWFPVRVENTDLCYRIEGVAVVLKDTIYASTSYSDMGGPLVLALSIRREDDLGFVCSLRCKISVDVNAYPLVGVTQRASHLVHLGKDNFCLVHSCQLHESRFDGYQPIKLTNIKLSGENYKMSMTVIDECVHLLRVPRCQEQFSVKLCFSLPECKTTAIKEGKNSCFNLDPFPEGYDPKQRFKIDSHCDRDPDEVFGYGPLVNVGIRKLVFKRRWCIGNLEEGHPIFGRNLWPNSTFGQFKKELMMKCGPSKRFEIRFLGVDLAAIIIEHCPPKLEENTHITEGCRAETEETEGCGAEMKENTHITEGCRAELEETEGCRAEMEETEGCRAEMEEITHITEGCRAEMEENGRIGVTADDNRRSKNARKKLKKKLRKQLKKELEDVGGGKLPLQLKPVLVWKLAVVGFSIFAGFLLFGALKMPLR